LSRNAVTTSFIVVIKMSLG